MIQHITSRYATETGMFMYRKFPLVLNRNKYSIREHIVTEGEKLTDLAWIEYGNAQYWWVIAEINGIDDVLGVLQAGMKLNIPDREILKTIGKEDY